MMSATLHTPVRALAFLLVAASSLLAQGELANGSFEREGERIPAWRVEDGASTGGDKASTADVDRDVAHAGKASLRLSGDDETGKWSGVWQDVALDGADELRIAFWTRARGLRREARQTGGAHGIVAFYGRDGRRLMLNATPALRGDSDWAEQAILVEVPPVATRAALGFYLGTSGTMWVDDVRVERARFTAFATAAAGAAWDKLVGWIDRAYPFATAEQHTAFAKRAGELAAGAREAADRKAFVAALSSLLDPLGDANVVIEDDHAAVPGPNLPDPGGNWNVAAIRAELDEVLYEQSGFVVARTHQGVGYVGIGNFLATQPASVAFATAMLRLADAPSIIVDVRANKGGNEKLAQLFADSFAAEQRVYSRRRTRLGSGLAPWEETKFGPATRGQPYTRPVFVLQGRHTVGAGEAFVMMMGVLPHVTTVGQSTRGACGNSLPVRLTTELRVFVPQWQIAASDGHVIGAEGVPPRVAVDGPTSAYAKDDPTLRKAIELAPAK